MYSPKDFSHLIGLPGFSDTLMTNHFTLYGGYVTNANKLIEKLNTVERGGYEYGELKRRLGWEVNGIKLHELFFENLSKEKSAPGELTKALIEKTYGTMEEWEASVKRNMLTRGVGWVLLVRDNDTGAVFHTWIGEHNVGNLVNVTILLALDVWEHAFMTDYGIKRPDYINALLPVINWNIVEERAK